MSGIDWLVMGVAIMFIVLYGIWKSRGAKNIQGYLLADRQMPWYHVGLSVMATQASAITFLSAPGQGYGEGLSFIQFYFGLPLAMIMICVVFIPLFHRLNVYTAYEFLEQRFDLKTRSLTAFLFLLQRGLSTGLTIYAPAIILSVILDIDVRYTTLLMGGLVILYTTYGGTKAVSYTQTFQMAIIFGGLFAAAYMVVHMLPENVSFTDALHIAGKMDRLNAIDTKFDIHSDYNIWSGIIGGFFLQLSYFGTDQSQVGRYLTGKSVTQSRLGLIMNGLVKIPMQFFILLIGTLVFTFYQFHPAPVFFNQNEVKKIEQSPYGSQYKNLEAEYNLVHEQKRQHVDQLVDALHQDDERKINTVRVLLHQDDQQGKEIRKKVVDLMKENDKSANLKDRDYIFLNFVTEYLPVGLVGLLIAIIFLAAMGSTASGLNSLASTTIVDFYKRFGKKNKTEREDLKASRWATMGWGLFCMVVAFFAHKFGNLIEAVNILGSWFYGTILGIFMVAFFLKRVGGTSVFIAAIITEILVILSWSYELTAFLWLNVIGCGLVMLLSLLFEVLLPKKEQTTAL